MLRAASYSVDAPVAVSSPHPVSIDIIGTLLGAFAVAIAVGLPLRFLIRARIHRYMRENADTGGVAPPGPAPLRDAPPLHFTTEVYGTPRSEEGHRLFARMQHARFHATAIYVVAGVAAAFVAAMSNVVVTGIPAATPGRLGLFISHLGPVLVIFAAVAVPSFRSAVVGLVLAYGILGVVTPMLVRDVWLTIHVIGFPPTLLFLTVDNRWLKTIAPGIVVVAAVPVMAYTTATVGVYGGHFSPAMGVPVFAILLAIGVLSVYLVVVGYEKKWLTDHSIRFTFLWILFMAVWTWSRGKRGVDVGWWAAGAVVLYTLLAHSGLLVLRNRARAHYPTSLLVLRVFGSPRRSQRLFEEVGIYWRSIGPLHLLGGTDSIIANLDIADTMRCLGFRIRTLFVASDADLQRRMETLDCAPDPDGRYRVNDLFCRHAMWQPTFAALLRRSDAVLVDLSGYGPEHQGVTYELAQLLAQRPPDSFVLITDRTANRELLTSTLDRLWHEVDPFAANARSERPEVRVLHRPKPRALVAALCDAAVAAGSETHAQMRYVT